MRRVVWMALLALALPLAAWADSTSIFSDYGGKITLGAGNSLWLSNSTLDSFTLDGVTTGGKGFNLGSVNFTTGGLISGSMGGGGVFASGGSFTVMGNGTNGLANGVLFSGTFSNPVDWIATWNPAGDGGKGNWTYVLTGALSGTLSDGSPVSGATAQFTFDVPGSKPFSKSVRLSSGVTTVTVPEPGTLALFGTGMVGLVGLMRRALKTKT